MNGFVPDPTAWMRLLVEAQKMQLDAAEKLVEASGGPATAEQFDKARQQLESAGQQAIDATEQWVKAQMQWIAMWRF